MSVIARINNLIDAHEDYSKCKGCKLCKEIERLRSGIDREPAEKYAHILSKGQDMTKSEILFLLNNEVNAKQIFTAMQMGGTTFEGLLANYGFEKSADGTWIENRKGIRKMALTKEKLEKHLSEGKSTKEIAEIEGVSTASVYSSKSYYGLSEKRQKSVEKLESVKQEVKKAAAENPAIEQELRALIARLEDEVGEHKINEVFLNNSIKQLQEENEEYKQQNTKLHEEIENLKASAEDTEQEAHEATWEIKRLKSRTEGLSDLLKIERQKITRLEKELENTEIFKKALKAAL